ncbi:Tetratricopeptide repeat protein 25 [Branchiostoma belcheri]|nr:Tetratricopeptide repeat protein 25 [Branchiostoma belcheri]
MASGKNILTVYIEVEEEKGQEDKKEEKDNKEDDTKAEEKNELDSENLEVVSEDEEELEKEEEEEEGRKTTRHKGTIAAMVVLKIFGLAFFINYLVNVAGLEDKFTGSVGQPEALRPAPADLNDRCGGVEPVGTFDSCSVPGEKRQACGSWSTSERECLDMGCCYRSPFGVPNAPWCYQKASEKETNNWFLPSSSEEDSSDEMDPDRDTAVDLGSILDWMMGNNDDKPSGNEDTEDPPASPHHSPHHRSPDDDHTQHRAPDRHGLMPPNLHRDPSNPNCDNPLHRGDSGNPSPRYPAPETPHHAPTILPIMPLKLPIMPPTILPIMPLKLPIMPPTILPIMPLKLPIMPPTILPIMPPSLPIMTQKKNPIPSQPLVASPFLATMLLQPKPAPLTTRNQNRRRHSTAIMT